MSLTRIVRSMIPGTDEWGQREAEAQLRNHERQFKAEARAKRLEDALKDHPTYEFSQLPEILYCLGEITEPTQKAATRYMNTCSDVCFQIAQHSGKEPAYRVWFDNNSGG
ncbi:MAG: hypothetical protein EPN86_04955 [Nanoarchaeota archaeon]|nr:MAG: hypothetical protein EPN86_04955 [Nanoarchaeota archaeon]